MLAPTLPSKTVLVTGCSSGGVGAAFASSFAAAGDSQTYHVYATARSPSKIPASLHSAPNVTVLALDVTSSDSIKAAVEAVRRETGERLDVLINVPIPTLTTIGVVLTRSAERRRRLEHARPRLLDPRCAKALRFELLLRPRDDAGVRTYADQCEGSGGEQCVCGRDGDVSVRE